MNLLCEFNINTVSYRVVIFSVYPLQSGEVINPLLPYLKTISQWFLRSLLQADISVIFPSIFHLSNYILPLWFFVGMLPNSFRAKSYIRISSYHPSIKTEKGILFPQRKILTNSQLKRNIWVTPPLPHFPNPYSNLQTYQSQFD